MSRNTSDSKAILAYVIGAPVLVISLLAADAVSDLRRFQVATEAAECAKALAYDDGLAADDERLSHCYTDRGLTPPWKE